MDVRPAHPQGLGVGWVRVGVQTPRLDASAAPTGLTRGPQGPLPEPPAASGPDGCDPSRGAIAHGGLTAILTIRPTTARAVPMGQHASLAVFEREAFDGARFRCPACHQAHSWSKDQAWLAPGALAGSGAASLIETAPSAGE